MSTTPTRTLEAVDKMFSDLVWTQGQIIQRKLDLQKKWIWDNPGQEVPKKLQLTIREMSWILQGKELVRKSRVMERTAKKEEAEAAVLKRKGGRPAMKLPMDPKAHLPSAVDIEELRAAYAQPEEEAE